MICLNLGKGERAEVGARQRGATAEPIMASIDGVIPAVTLQKPRVYLAAVARLSEKETTSALLVSLLSFIFSLGLAVISSISLPQKHAS